MSFIDYHRLFYVPYVSVFIEYNNGRNLMLGENEIISKTLSLILIVE